jgi:hypothetical protein
LEGQDEQRCSGSGQFGDPVADGAPLFGGEALQAADVEEEVECAQPGSGQGGHVADYEPCPRDVPAGGCFDGMGDEVNAHNLPAPTGQVGTVHAPAAAQVEGSAEGT